MATARSREAGSRSKIRVGFSIAIGLNVVIALVSLLVLRWVVASKDTVIYDHAQDLSLAQEARSSWNQSVSGWRAFLLTREDWFRGRAETARGQLHKALGELKRRASTDSERELLAKIDREVVEHDRAVGRATALAREGRSPADVVKEFEEIVAPEGRESQHAFEAFIGHKEAVLEQTRMASQHLANRATLMIGGLGAASLLLAGGTYLLAARTLRRLAESERQTLRFNENLELRVQERTRAVQEAMRELETFSYTIAHDLRAPLRAMAGFTQLITVEETPVEERKGHGQRIVDAARRMDQLILDLLDYSRLSRMELALERVHLRVVMSDVLEGLEDELHERRAQVTLEGDAWPVVQAHAPVLGQALRNLISNAAKFVAEGVEPRIRVRVERVGPRYRLWVEDNGIGIAREHQAVVFGLFQRLHPTVERYPGTGIGLAIVRRSLERMGGTVGFESEPGRGSRFWVELPEAPELEPRAAVPPPSAN